MILDEIYKTLIAVRINHDNNINHICPFQRKCHSICQRLFPEIEGTKKAFIFLQSEPMCPCEKLTPGYVKSEMQRLFP